MSKMTEEFLGLYRTYESMLRARGVEYKDLEEKLNSDRMRIMRQMRNYLVHADDPGFIEISDVCLKALEHMVKEEALKGDIVKNHLVSPAKGSVKEGTLLSSAVYTMVKSGLQKIPVYDDKKLLKGLLVLDKAAYILDKHGNIPVDEKSCGPYGTGYTLVTPETPAENGTGKELVCCTKDGTLKTQYLGYLDK